MSGENARLSNPTQDHVQLALEAHCILFPKIWFSRELSFDSVGFCP